MKIINAVQFELSFDKQKPFVFDIQDLNRLSVFAGANGSGKTVIMQLIWFMGFISVSYKALLRLDYPNKDKYIVELIETLLPCTWDFETIDLNLTLFSNNNQYRIDLVVKDSKVDYFNFGTGDIKIFLESGPDRVVFGSKNSRQFVDYERYISIRNRLFGPTQIDLKEMIEMKDMYKAYDILWFEDLEKKFFRWHQTGIPTEIQRRVKRMLANFPNIDENDDNPLFFIDTKLGINKIINDSGEKVPTVLSKLSSGEQSMLMMLISTGV